MSRVLIIEDEAMLRTAMARGIAKIPDIIVSEAGTLEQALTEIDRELPHVIVSDIDLPGRSGIELLGELGRRGKHIPIVFASGYLKAYRSQIPQHADVEILEKPVVLEQLRERVKKLLARSRSELSAPFSLPDYLQLACMGRHSVKLRVLESGRELGTVLVWQGQVLAAQDEQGSGEDAFSRLAFISQARVSCESLRQAPAEPNVTGNWEHLLMDAARKHDESARELHTLEPLQDKPRETSHATDELAAPASSVRETERETSDDLESRLFSRAWDQGVEALLAKRYTDALEAFLEAEQIRPEEAKVKANIARLRQLGIEASEAPAPDSLQEVSA